MTEAATRMLEKVRAKLLTNDPTEPVFDRYEIGVVLTALVESNADRDAFRESALRLKRERREVAEEREACAKAICSKCAMGIPVSGDGHHGSATSDNRCAAAAIRARQ